MHCLSTPIRLLLPLVFVFWSSLSAAQTEEDYVKLLADFTASADRIEARINDDVLLDDEIESDRAVLENFRKQFSDASDLADAAIAPLIAELDALGPAPAEGQVEATEIARLRERLGTQIESIDVKGKRAQQAATRARALMDQLNELRRTRFTQRLLERGESPLEPGRIARAGRSIHNKASSIYSAIRTRAAVRLGGVSVVDQFALPLFLIALAAFVAVVLRRWVVARLLSRVDPSSSAPRRVGLGLALTLSRLLLPGMAVGLVYFGLSNSPLLDLDSRKLLSAFVEGAGILIGAYALGRAFYAPDAPDLRMTRLPPEAAGRAHGFLMALACVVALHRFAVLGADEIGLGIDALNVLNAGLLILGGIALWAFVKAGNVGLKVEAASKDDTEDEESETQAPAPMPIDRVKRAGRFIALAVAILSPVFALAGYYRASQFLFYPLVQSGALIGICLLIYLVAKALAGAGDRAKSGSEQVPEGPSGGVFPVLIGFLLSMAAAPILALIWGANSTDLIEVWGRIVDGFQVGEIKISPIDFLIFTIVLTIGYILTRMMQGVLRRSVLPLTRMDEGAKSAVLAGVGYIGIVVAALIAVSTTGLDLSNLAIVAGALSVGIGFGLQNVVNNFVSGIILLVERPIKTGDWVEISGVHGTVRKVNVRSTEIQTFDRSTMFVPNADLISGTVTNWTHGNSMGRIIVTVGVAYGSDVRKVEKVLLEIARSHTMLMRRPAPYVVFKDFGADSLNFEIRGVLRDVNWILNVGSDLRYSIYERFTEEGIEIPFAQRDLHIKNLHELGPMLHPGRPVSDPDAGAGGRPPRAEGPDTGEPDADGDPR